MFLSWLTKTPADNNLEWRVYLWDLGPIGREDHPALHGRRAAHAEVSRVRIDSSVRSIDSRAAELMSRPMKTRRMAGMDRLSVSDSHSTRTPPSTAE